MHVLYIMSPTTTMHMPPTGVVYIEVGDGDLKSFYHDPPCMYTYVRTYVCIKVCMYVCMYVCCVSMGFSIKVVWVFN